MNHIMRDGTTVRDSRLGRLKEHDPKALRKYPMRRLLGESLASGERKPRSYTWQVPVHLNQRNEGACVPFTWRHELAAKPVVMPFQSDDIARSDYWSIQREDQWEGGSYPGANPFYEGTSVIAGARYYTNLGFYKSYWWAQTEEEIAMAVAYKGPAVIGVNWYEGMMQPDQHGYVRPIGQIVGGHCTLLHAFNYRSARYTIWNSWGNTWGMNGTAYLKREDMARLLGEDGEACVPVRMPYRFK